MPNQNPDGAPSNSPSLTETGQIASASDSSSVEYRSQRFSAEAEGESANHDEKLANLDDNLPVSSQENDEKKQAQFEPQPGFRKFEGIHREKFWQIWRPKNPPPPPPTSLNDATLIPLANASFISRIFFQWMTPMMVLGYQRPLEATDLWALSEDISSQKLGDRLLADWDRRVKQAEQYNIKLENGEIHPGFAKKLSWQFQSAFGNRTSVKEREAAWRAPPVETKSDKHSKKPLGSGHKKPSLSMALHDQVGRKLWTGLVYKVIGDTSQITSPLVLKAIIEFAQEHYVARFRGEPAPNVGKGIGLSFALFFMQIIASLCSNQFFWNSMSVGVESRAALITSIFSRAMKMNGKARSSGKLVNHISTDCSRIDFAAGWFTIIIAAPIQIIVCLIILLNQLGVSALAGFVVFILSTPVQTQMVKALFRIRRASMKWTDQRAKSIQVVLAGMRIVKSFSYESNFLKRIQQLRKNELNGIRKILIIRSAYNAFAMNLPIISAVLAFVVYGLTGHSLNPAIIFPSLTLFQLLRMPLMFYPLSLSATTDALNAFQRLDSVYTAEQLDTSFDCQKESDDALVLSNACFQWEPVEPHQEAQSSQGPTGGTAQKKRSQLKNIFKKKQQLNQIASLPTPVVAGSTSNSVALHQQAQEEQEANVADEKGETTATEEKTDFQLGQDDQDSFIDPQDGVECLSADTSAVPRDGQVSGLGAARSLINAATAEVDGVDRDNDSAVQEPFSMNNLNLRIAKGELVAIVGPVGSGKSSLLQACIGEMRKTGGSVTWGTERVAYCSQNAWIQNATVRDNVLFGQPFEEERYWAAIKISELEADLAILTAGDMTEIGEKGVNLSGGQKQRVNIARALYFGADIVCFDDPLSAVDAHVGKALFYNAILGLKQQGKTVILVTHALHFLPEMDRIITMENGQIAETGTYAELLGANGPFQRLVAEFGGEAEKEEEKKEEEAEGIEDGAADSRGSKPRNRDELSGEKGSKAGTLMQAEERNTGSVSAHVYLSYFKFGKGLIMVPLCIISVILMQVFNILNSYWLVWWQENKFNKSEGFYMAIYAALGIAAAIFTFCMGTAMGFLSYYSCKRLHAAAITRVIYAPMSWLDQTPLGRIMNRFFKDVDVVDNQLADAIRMATATLASVVGAVILITILTHYFVVAVAIIMVLYFFGALFYRSSAREIKRLGAILRSHLYSHFSETLSGLATIRAYREVDSFVKENQKRMDIENRAYYLSITNQRWLGVRLDILSAALVLIVAIMTTCNATPLSAGNVGIALSYMLSVSQAFGWMTRQIAEVENDSASVERLLYYAEELDQEAVQIRKDNPVRESWPEQGTIDFNNVCMSYRPGLPAVLKGISFKVESSEKVGIVGRTGAGKSSLLTVLLRLVELSQGSITIDGVDISQIGVEDLRRRMAILPQDPLLFSGTMRSNLDPFNQYDDARLNDALKRAYLISDDTDGQQSPVESDPHADSEGRKTVSRFNLDSVVEEEGANLSVGQRSLVSLARALVKNSKIILLDEATASVDLETDSKIQATIREEFANRTILCIAHRLRTILAYDRIAVFDQGLLVEYDSPLGLFDKDGVFRSMCERSNITREEMLRHVQEKSLSTLS